MSALKCLREKWELACSSADCSSGGPRLLLRIALVGGCIGVSNEIWFEKYPECHSELGFCRVMFETKFKSQQLEKIENQASNINLLVLPIDCETELLKNPNNCWLLIPHTRKWLSLMSVFMFLKDAIYTVLTLTGGFNFMRKFSPFSLDVGSSICFSDLNGGKAWDRDVRRELTYRGTVLSRETRMIRWMIRTTEVEKVLSKPTPNHVIMCNIHVKCRKEPSSKRKEHSFFSQF